MTLFEQVRALMNLIENAINYTPRGQSIQVSTVLDNAMAVFTVRDTGIGIAKEEQATIFNRFYRASNARSTTSGTGLGLAIVKKVIEHHAGQINVASELGQGTTFTVRLPHASAG